MRPLACRAIFSGETRMFARRMVATDHDSVAELLRASGVDVELDAELSRPFARLWVACLDGAGDPVSFLLAWHVADEVHVHQVVTRPDRRRRGAAGALVDAAIRYAAESGARMLLLEVRRGNEPAIQLYRSRGFRVIRVRRGYYERDGEDALEMALNLNPQTGAAPPSEDLVSA